MAWTVKMSIGKYREIIPVLIHLISFHKNWLTYLMEISLGVTVGTHKLDLSCNEPKNGSSPEDTGSSCLSPRQPVLVAE